MHLRTRTWAALSLLCFGIGGYLWHLGNQRARQSAPAHQTNLQPATSNAALTPLPPSAAPLLSVRAAQAPAQAVEPPAASTAEPKEKENEKRPDRFRLRNTAQPLAELLRSDNALLLRNALVDRTGTPLVVPEHLRAGPEAEAFIVQARGPITENFRTALRAAGAEVVSYVPNNAYLVRAVAGGQALLAGLPDVAWVGAWEPYFKLGADVLEPLAEQQPLPEGTLLQVVGFPGLTERTRAELEQAGAEVLAEGRSPFGPRWVVRPAVDRVADLARLASVQLIELFRERLPANDLTRVRVKVSTNTTAASPADQYLGLTGQGVLVSVNDSGVDGGHPDLAGRVIGTTNDLSGHGTHVIGTILGDGSRSSTVDFASGSTNGANFRGMAPAATGFVQRVFWAGPRLNDEYLQETAAATNARVQNNSWFYGVFDYDIHAASFDAAVRDALPGRTGEQPLLVVFAAGNSGRGASGGLGGLADTIQSPGTAKNAITVGAIEAPRFITNEVELANQTNAPWLGLTDSDDEVAGFSARGNTGRATEGSFGRFKPDVVAPGAMVVSCRSQDYVDPMGRLITNAISRAYANQVVAPGGTNRYGDYIRDDAVSFSVAVTPNADSPVPFPNLEVYLEVGGNPLTFGGVNGAVAVPPTLAEGPATFEVVNPTLEPVSYNLNTVQRWTNDIGNFREVFSNMNFQLGPYYRYESGSSMSAAAVSGMLALMEEYFQTQGLTNSPALMKALLINGARSVGDQYDVQPRAVINHQGWGLPTLPNILPAAKADGASTVPVQFVEQDATNSLGTGWSHTRTVTVGDASRNFPLRFTLVWTDPPANPAVDVKLVNNLDLVVTNLDNPNEVYVGNWFREGSNFSEPLGTNGLDTNFLAAVDFVNNVENVVLQPPLANGRYSVTVRGLRVNVNAATTASPDRIAQDYALVVSCGNTNFDGRITLTAAPTLATNIVPFVQTFGTNLVLLLNQRVGANPPYWSTTNGALEQWNFYVFTNVTSFTNVAIATFLPRNLAHVQANLLNPVANRTPRYFEADLDLFVSLNPTLTNLNPLAIANADRSVGRLGTEMLIYSNATPGRVYYIGVKSEDQQSADYVLFTVASESPFSNLDDEGNQVINCLPLAIPDGTPDNPGGTTMVCFATMPMTIQNVVATNAITHENPGDLIGTLTHDDVSVVLLNHYNWLDDTGGDPTAEFVYDDTEEEPGSVPSDGPGKLTDYLGEEAQGMWFFDIVDNALHHTGRVELLTLRIEPTVDTNLTALDDYAVFLTNRLVQPNGWLVSAVNVPYDATNLEVCVSTPAPVELYVRRGQVPTRTEYDHWMPVGVPGDCLSITPNSVPPLVPGRYYLGLYNPGGAAVRLSLTARVQRDTRPGPLLTYENTNGVPLLDDALTNSYIAVTNQQAVAMVQVGVRIDHERASDLVLHLISPQGTRVLLAENRGLMSTNGYGINFTNITTNIVATVLDNGFEGVVPGQYSPPAILSGWQVSAANVDIVANGSGMLAPPHSGTNALDIQGWDNGFGSLFTNIATIPGLTYRLSFVYAKNPGWAGTPTAAVRLGGTAVCSLAPNWPNAQTDVQWRPTSVVYRATSPLTRLELTSGTSGNAGVFVDTFRMEQVEIITNLYRYATFTEDQRLTQTPIKFGTAPFANTNLMLTNVLISGFETVPPADYVEPVTVDGWNVLTNAVTVISNQLLAYAGTNFLALRQGVISRTLPTVPGNEYELRFAYRADPRRQGLFNTGVDDFGAALPDATADPHYRIIQTPSAASVDLPSFTTVPGNQNSEPGVWVPTTPGYRWIVSDALNNITAPAGSYVFRTTFDLTGYDPNSVVIQGQWAIDNRGVDIVVNGLLTGISTLGGWDGWSRFHPFTLNTGFTTGLNRIDFVTDNEGPGADWMGLLVEFTTFRASAIPGFVPTASAEVRLDALGGTLTNTFVAITNNWRQMRLKFVAAADTTPLEVLPSQGRMWLDHFELVETGNRYWLPEEPMTPIFGQNAFGVWTLELWDSRLGGAVTNTPRLLAWQLQLGYIRTNPPTVLLTNGQDFTGVVSNNAWLYFAVDVPCTNGWMTNTITTDGPVDVFYNPVELPTDGLSDILLEAGLTGTRVFGPFQVPSQLSPGRYYLGLRNNSPNTEVNATVRSDAVCDAPPPPPAPVINAGGSGVVWTPAGSPAFRLQWNGPPLAKFQVQFADSVEGPWYVVPGVITSGTSDFTFLDDGSWTAPLIATRFYRIVLLP